MPAPLGYPFFHAFTPTGAPGAGYLVYTYEADSSTPAVTYTDADLIGQNSNPVVLDANGEAVIWLDDSFYKIVLHTDLDVPVWTIDNVSGTAGSASGGGASSTIDFGWLVFTGVPTYISATVFSLVGDQTSTFNIGRRVKSTNTGGTTYSTIVGSVFSTVTTVTLINNSGVLDSGLSQVSIGMLTATTPVWTRIDLEQSTTATLSNGVIGAIFGIVPSGTTTVNCDVLGEWSNSQFTAKVAGTYRVRLVVTFEEVTALTISGGTPSFDVLINAVTDTTYTTQIADQLLATQSLFPPAVMEFTKVLAVGNTINFTTIWYFSSGSVRIGRAHLVLERIA